MEPKRARENFLKLRNFGVTTADELDRIMESVTPPSMKKATDEENMFEIPGLRQNAIHAVESFCVGLIYPNDLLEEIPSDSLANLLETERACHHGPFSDFLKTYDRTISRLRLRRNCGLKDINELDRVISQLLGKRLDNCGIDQGIETYMRFLMRGGTPPGHMLESIIALENVQPEILQTIESQTIRSQPDENLDISEMISSALSKLDPRQYDIIGRRYGIGTGQSETLEDISSCYDISRERIRQIQAGAMKKMASRRMVISLTAALKNENIVQDLFSDRKIITMDRVGKIYNSLEVEKRLAIDIAYGSMKDFLDAGSIRSRGAWVQEENLHMMESGSGHLMKSLGKRIIAALRKQRLPINLSDVISEIPDYPELMIRNEITDTMKISIDGDIIDPSTLGSTIRYLLVLREAGHAMNLQEIQTAENRLFDKIEKIDKIQSIITHDPEFLIVDRGTYNIFENLVLTPENLADIQDCAYHYLKVIGGFISVKVLFSRLFKNITEHFGDSFGPYMLLGILHHDARFVTCRGLMIGLESENEKTEYRSLGEDIQAVLLKTGKIMTLTEIVEHLEIRRDVQETSVGMAIQSMPDVTQFGRGKYGLAEGTIRNRD